MSISAKKLSLTQRAILTLVSTFFVQLAEFLTGFFITPLIIRGIGQELYGAWGMLQQILGYFSLTEFRATASLRFLLSLRQHRETETEEKQRLIGSALMLWAISLPFTLVLGIGLVLLLPLVVRVEATSASGVRVALIILMVNAILDRLLAIPMHILKAQNLDYKGVGINTSMVLIGSLLSGLVVWLGWGLPGLAAATMTNVMLISVGRFWVARKAIPWIAVKRPTREDFLRFIKTSSWLFVGGLAALLLYSTDALVVGMLIGPTISATYITSGSVLRMIGEPLYQIVASGNAGLIGLCGEQAWDRVAGARKEMYFLILFFMTILGTGVIALNGAFLKLWLGIEFFGGTLLTLFLVVSILLTFLSRIDYTITDAMLFLREKTWALFVAGSLAIIIGVLALKSIGLAGMALGMASGNLLLVIISWNLIQRRLPNATINLGLSIIRPALIMSLTYTAALLLQPHLDIQNWPTFIGAGLVIGFLALIIAWFFVLTIQVRQAFWIRAQQNIPFLKK